MTSGLYNIQSRSLQRGLSPLCSNSSSKVGGGAGGGGGFGIVYSSVLVELILRSPFSSIFGITSFIFSCVNLLSVAYVISSANFEVLSTVCRLDCN